MATNIKDCASSFLNNIDTGKMQLIQKIDFEHNICMACQIEDENEEGIISAHDDKTVRVSLKRDNGKYWPSICVMMPSLPTYIEFESKLRLLFIGMDNGTISEYKVSEDYNKATHVRDYLAHIMRVTCINYSVRDFWLLSCGRDKNFQWHCTKTGKRLGGYVTGAWCTSLQYDRQAKYAFIGDYKGHISVLKISPTGFELITTIKGHDGSVCCLCWDAEKNLLFSGSFDQSIIVWDIGGQKGNLFQLQGHREKVQSLIFIPEYKCLLSGSDDAMVVIWDLNKSRQECPEWLDSNNCQKCDVPFIWNIKSMWENKSIGMRQHHCRKCGQAKCDNCCSRKSRIPSLGFEYPVRICNECESELSEEDKKPLASFQESKHNIINMSYSNKQKILITAGKDKIIKLWDMKDIFK